jgi:hypothetical protein
MATLPPRGDGRARCISADAELCDFATFEQRCTDDATGYLTCPTNVATITQNCDIGERCVMGDGSPECIPVDEELCVPATFAPVCLENAPVQCSRAGFTQTAESCDPGDCHVNLSGRAICTEAGATTCDHSGRACIDGDVKSCAAGYTVTEVDCGDDEQCITDRCFPADAQPCTDELSRCDADGAVLRCNRQYGVFVAEACPEGTFCLDTPGGTTCHGEDEVACDALTFEERCVDATHHQRCSAYLDYTQTVVCPDACRVSDTGGWCADAAAAACDPAAFTSSCSGDVATTCSVESHFVTSETCPDGFECLQDDFGVLSFALCFPEGQPSCTEPADQSCADASTLQWCVGGALLQFDCAAEQTCTEDGIRAVCVPDNAPTCDPATFVSSCEDKFLVRECFAGREVVSNCNNVGERCDPATGACEF